MKGFSGGAATGYGCVVTREMDRRRFLLLSGKVTLGLLVGVGCGPAGTIDPPPIDPVDPIDPIDPVDPICPDDPAPIDGPLLETLAVAAWRAADYDPSLGHLPDLSGNCLHAMRSDPAPIHLPHDGTSYLYFPGTVGNTLTVPRPAVPTYWRAAFEDGPAAEGSSDAITLAFGGEQAAFAGKGLRRLTLYSDSARTAIVGRFDASLVDERRHHMVDAFGNVWTIDRSPSGLKCAVVDRPLFLLAHERHFTVPSHPLLDFREDQDFTVVIAVRAFGEFGASSPVLMAKGASGATPSLGWSLRAVEQTLRPLGVIVTGSGGFATGAAERSLSGVPIAVALRRSGAELALMMGDTVEDEVAASAADIATTEELRIGRSSGSGTSNADMEFIGAAVFRTSLTPTQMELLVDEFGMDAIDVDPSLATAVEGMWLGVPA
jgi:hypothetical protein